MAFPMLCLISGINSALFDHFLLLVFDEPLTLETRTIYASGPLEGIITIEQACVKRRNTYPGE